MKTTNTIELNAFVVPNSARKFEDFSCCVNQQKSYLANIGMFAKDDKEPLIEVWMHGGGEDNCTDHGYTKSQLEALGLPEDAEGTGLGHDAFGRIHAPSYLPYHIVKDVKEGDTREFTAPNGCIVKIKFEQLPYRYRNHGRFEEVVEERIASFHEYYG